MAPAGKPAPGGSVRRGRPLPRDNLYYDPASRPGRQGRPGRCGTRVACRKADDPDQSNPEPDESLVLPCIPLYGTVRVDAWRGVHPLINGDRGYFAGWDGGLPVLRGTLLHVTVDHLPDRREPLKAMWLWHADLRRPWEK